jgi:hypothetical protein
VVSKLAAVKLTGNFEANLAEIERFWSEAGAPQAYDALLDYLLDTVIVNLERHPKMGRDFLSRPIHSVEAQTIVERLRTRIGRGEMREYLAGDYLILYALVGDCVQLLCIRHHRQVSFDFVGLWTQ